MNYQHKVNFGHIHGLHTLLPVYDLELFLQTAFEHLEILKQSTKYECTL